jgi:hypothetical protein
MAILEPALVETFALTLVGAMTKGTSITGA